MRLDLYKGGVWHSLIDGDAAGGYVYSWIVPRVLGDGDDYRIRVASATYVGGELFSPPFSIRGGAPLALQVLAPNGGEAWQLDAPAVVRWTGDPAIAQVTHRPDAQRDRALDAGRGRGEHRELRVHRRAWER